MNRKENCAFALKTMQSTTQTGKQISPSAPVEVTVTAGFESPLESVWKKLGRFSSIENWQRAVKYCATNERSDGIYRVVVMHDDTAFVERLEFLSHDTTTLAYSIVSSPLDIKDYLCTLQFTRESANKTLLKWKAQFNPNDPNQAETLKNSIYNLFKMGVNGMQQFIESEN